MRRPDISSVWWRWLLCAALSLRASAEPQFLVVLPAVVESGTAVRFCFSLLQVSEDLSVTVSLEHDGEKRVVYKETHEEGNTCATFQAPVVEDSEIQNFVLEIQGKNFHSTETKKIQIRNYGLKTFIQTDKPLYLPGQTDLLLGRPVYPLDAPGNMLRMLSLCKLNLTFALLQYELIEIKDSVSNRVAQWLERSSGGGILQLSYDLDPEAKEGEFSLTVINGRVTTTVRFQVEKYVLPKFSLKVAAPTEVSVGLEELSFKACAKYTFGQPVPGSMEVRVCRNPKRLFYMGDMGRFPVCRNQQQQVSKDGCASFSIPTAQFHNQSSLYDEFNIIMRMNEEGTDYKSVEEKRVKISYQIGKLEFVNPPNRFNPGDVLDIQVKAVHHNDTPLAHTDVHLLKDPSYSLIQTLKTDQDGLATFKFNTSNYSNSVSLRASVYDQHKDTQQTPHFAQVSLVLKEIKPPSLHTRTTSTLGVQALDRPLVCGDKESFTLTYTFVGESQGVVTIIYLILSRGVIVKYGQSREYMDTTREGEMTFSQEISPDLAPDVTLVAYAVLPSERVIATSRDFITEKCFSNEVALQFMAPSSVPGELSSLTVSAAPRSLCGVSAVDKSVLILKAGRGLEPDGIFSLMPVRKAERFPESVEDAQGCVKVRSRRSRVRPVGRDSKDDVYSLLKNRGLKMATNLFIRTPSCVDFRGFQFYQHLHHDYDYVKSNRRGNRIMFASPVRVSHPPPPPPPIQTVRTFFPETWIWDLVEVGESGQVALPLTVPDTITTWEGGAFCLSPERGMGLAARQELIVFQPFFLELMLPFSIIRGESFELKATVFNYLSSCIMMDVRAAPSSDFILTTLSSVQYTSCLCGNERKTVSWTLLASALGDVNVTVTAEAITSAVQCDNEILSVPEQGRVDVVTKVLRVEAEGTQVSKAYNWLLCPKGEPLKEQLELTLPDNVIPGSARASVSVLGDILGRAMKNLDGLLKMPYGCGEQNIALLAPNIYILQYLKDTRQLSPDVMDRALKFLSSGYQRQLNYKHSDGGYSAFGRGQGNTWLTAFVVRCFAKAQAFVFIDPITLHMSRGWLQRMQKDDGCFRSSGKLFNNRMKGGVSDDVTLSAYITAAFLEMNSSRTDPVVERSLSCLKNHSQNTENVYTTALMAYVFSLAGDAETRAELLSVLRSRATEQGGQMHWASSSSASLSVEISSYVLLSTLTQASVGVTDLGHASKIVRWLTGQQNPYGGFQSTQDTVVALQALSLYSTLVFSPGGSSSVLVQDLTRPTVQPLSFTVDQSNKLLYQERPLGGATGQYGLEVTGSACASVQISTHYNIPTRSEVKTLGVKVISECEGRSMQLILQALYFGEQNSTNMVILDVKMLSGFVASLKDVVSQLQRDTRLDRVEESGGHVLIYIREVSHHRRWAIPLSLTQETVVENLKPAVVKIYDYYQPSDEAETEYTFTCAAQDA
ncbi:alpha-2-macroglobulin-like [Eucyclogobius newberryi]|uniref:alpha-2-macroglobulin-like n=1 Tax=Eucyclogobius newberryi TaxID=166745 RepID=UPI003B5B9D24